MPQSPTETPILCHKATSTERAHLAGKAETHSHGTTFAAHGYCRQGVPSWSLLLQKGGKTMGMLLLRVPSKFKAKQKKELLIQPS